MKKRNDFQKYFVFFLVILFFSIAIFIRERELYNRVLVEKAFEVYPTSEGRTGVALQKLTDYLDIYGESLNEVPVVAGDYVEGALYLKNNFLQKKIVSLITFGDLREVRDEKKLEDVKKDGLIKDGEESFEVEDLVEVNATIESSENVELEGEVLETGENEAKKNQFLMVEFEDNSFEMLPGEWRYIKYKIKIPEDMETGRYSGQIAVRTQDELYYQGFNLVLAVGLNFRFEVVDEAVEYFTEHRGPLNVSPHSIAMGYVYSDLKKVMGYGFGVLALVFLYKGLATNNKPSKPRKTVKKKKE